MHVTDYASAYEGAFIRQLRMLDEEIRTRGGRPSSLVLTRKALEQPWAETLRRDGWELRELPAGSTRPQRRVAAAIADAARELQPDVMHVHFGTYDGSARLAVRRLRQALGEDAPRLAWHYRTALETTIEERALTRRLKDLLKYGRAGQDVDRFFAVTHALADEVVARGAAADRTHGIVAGCDTDIFRRDIAIRMRVRGDLALEPDDVLLLHMGWMWHRKGGDLLAEAMRTLEGSSAPGGGRIVACSIGAPEDAVLGSVRRLPMTDRVHEYHQASDIFISASRSEGFGNGLVEAMACENVAIAATAAGQIETFANLPGVSPIPVGSSAAIAASVRSLLERRAMWPALGAANRAHVLEHHSMRRWARDMTDAYAALCPSTLARHDDPAVTGRTEVA